MSIITTQTCSIGHNQADTSGAGGPSQHKMTTAKSKVPRQYLPLVRSAKPRKQICQNTLMTKKRPKCFECHWWVHIIGAACSRRIHNTAAANTDQPVKWQARSLFIPGIISSETSERLRIGTGTSISPVDAKCAATLMNGNSANVVRAWYTLYLEHIPVWN